MTLEYDDKMQKEKEAKEGITEQQKQVDHYPGVSHPTSVPEDEKVKSTSDHPSQSKNRPVEQTKAAQENPPDENKTNLKNQKPSEVGKDEI